MATLIPNLSACRWDAAGEQRFAERLLDKLGDDYWCWYNAAVGPSFSQPDFIILDPRHGLLVLEIKDWKLTTIQQISRERFTLLTGNGLEARINPLLQARACAQAIERALCKDRALIHVDGPYRGKLRFPYGYGVVLTNITRADFEQNQFGEVIPEQLAICKDEMTPSVDVERFHKRLWDMFSMQFGEPLTMPLMDRVRGHLFPEIRIRPQQLSLQGQGFGGDDEPLDLMKVMDIQQEQIARSLGEGHRVIHGVAGSGKTMLLIFRCLHLAKLLVKPVLVLCYNTELAAALAQRMKAESLDDKVKVCSFLSWCVDQCKLYGVDLPAPGEQFYKELESSGVARLIDAVERGQVPSAQYGAVLIDEGHDFAEDWLRLAVKMVDPQTRSLLLLYDDAQSIYGARRRSRFSLSSVGVEARGRTTILRINYRNTAEILAVARCFAAELLGGLEADEDGIPNLDPRSAGRHGPLPRLIECKDRAAELAYVASELRDLNRSGVSLNDMAVLCRTRNYADATVAELRRYGLPAARSAAKSGAAEAHITVATLHASKGLEYSVVAIPGLCGMPHPKAKDPDEEARVLYVGMTRATQFLLLTHHAQSAFVERMRAAIAELPA